MKLLPFSIEAIKAGAKCVTRDALQTAHDFLGVLQGLVISAQLKPIKEQLKTALDSK